MKSSTYDKIFDNMRSACWCLVGFTVILLLQTAVFSAAIYFYDELTWSLIVWACGAAFVPAVITTTVLILYKIACNRFGNIQFRDIWMAWATEIEYNLYDGDYEKCVTWIEQNINGLHRVHNSGAEHTFIFKQKTDAMAFKLTWEEEMSKNNSRR